MVKRLFLVLLLLLPYGCVTPTYQITTPYVESEHSQYSQRGDSVIVGQAFLKTKEGDVKYAAGDDIYLFPRTAYTTDFLDKVFKGGKVTNLDPRLKNVSRKTVADGEGRFIFKNIPSGEYYVYCSIEYEVPTGRGSADVIVGKLISKVNLGGGEKAQVILSGVGRAEWTKVKFH